jgi:hypothetical protein
MSRLKYIQRVIEFVSFEAPWTRVIELSDLLDIFNLVLTKETNVSVYKMKLSVSVMYILLNYNFFKCDGRNNKYAKYIVLELQSPYKRRIMLLAESFYPQHEINNV